MSISANLTDKQGNRHGRQLRRYLWLTDLPHQRQAAVYTWSNGDLCTCCGRVGIGCGVEFVLFL